MTRDRRSGPNITALTVSEARAHLSKAEEYLRTARKALDAGDVSAAGGNAVLAGINAADCVSGLVLGNRWDGAHEQAAAHVSRAGEDGQTIASHLRKLMQKKTQAHYLTKPLTKRQATELVQAADRALNAARRALARQDAAEK